MLSLVALLSFLVLSWKIELTSTRAALSLESNFVRNNSEFRTLSDASLSEDVVEKSNSEFHILASKAVLAENLVEQTDSEFHTYDNDSVSSENSDDNSSSNPIMYDDDYSDKNETFIKCDKWDYDPTEFVLCSNGSAFVISSNRTYEKPFYTLIDTYLIVCMPEDEEGYYNNMAFKDPRSYLALTGVIISIVCFSLHLIVFSLVPDLRNLSGCNLASLCSSLLLNYLFMLIGQHRENKDRPTFCLVTGILTYFFSLASFLWMFVIAFDVYRSTSLAATPMKMSNREFKVKQFLWYNLFSWFTALGLTITAIVVDHIEEIPDIFRPTFKEICWFKEKKSCPMFFVYPVGFLICLSFFMFGISTSRTFKNQTKSCSKCRRHNIKINLLYFGVTVVMSVKCIAGVTAPLVNAAWLWYVFDALNTTQGLFIFLAFTCSPKVKKYFKQKLCRTRKPSQQSQLTTFQSFRPQSSLEVKSKENVVYSNDKSQSSEAKGTEL